MTNEERMSILKQGVAVWNIEETAMNAIPVSSELLAFSERGAGLLPLRVHGLMVTDDR